MDVAILATGVVSTVLGARYLSLSTSQAVAMYRVGAANFMVASFVETIPSRDLIRTVLAWSGEGRNALRAPEVWKAIVSVPIALGRCAALGVVFIPATAAYIFLGSNKPWYGVLPVIIGLGVVLVGVWAVAVLVSQAMLRPMQEEVAMFLPRDFEAPASGLTLRWKALAPLPAVTFYAAVIAGAFANLTINGTLRFTIALRAALGIALVAAGIFAIVTRSALSPIDDLLQRPSASRQEISERLCRSSPQTNSVNSRRASTRCSET